MGLKDYHKEKTKQAKITLENKVWQAVNVSCSETYKHMCQTPQDGPYSNIYTKEYRNKGIVIVGIAFLGDRSKKLFNLFDKTRNLTGQSWQYYDKTYHVIDLEIEFEEEDSWLVESFLHQKRAKEFFVQRLIHNMPKELEGRFLLDTKEFTI